MNAITVVPLSQNLLRRVAEDIAGRFYVPGDPLSLARVTAIVPHRRGIVYLRHYLGQLVQQDKPLLLPRMITIEQLMSEIAVRGEERPSQALGQADQAWLLFRLVKEMEIYGDVAGSWDRFFRWGTRLAGIIDEIDREMIDPKDIIYPEDVPREARALLERLRDIYERFGRALSAEGYTTEAKRFRRAGELAQAPSGGSADEHAGEQEGDRSGRAGELTGGLAPSRDSTGAPAGFPAGPTYVVGFYATSRSEDRVFRHLFDAGASFFWHADPAKLPPLYRRWKEEWKVEARALPPAEPLGAAARVPGPRLHFHEAYDLHAEMRAAERVLTKDVNLPDQCAIVLPDPAALIPMLYHIPGTIPVNVSVGYPLVRSSIASLLELLMVLQEGRNKEGSHYYRDYFAVMRHPYVRRLQTPGGRDGRIVLHLLEDAVRQSGQPFLNKADALRLVATACGAGGEDSDLGSESADLEDAVAHLSLLHSRLVEPWQRVKTPRGLAAAIRETTRFLLEPFVGEPRFAAGQALDNEFVHALGEQVIPALEDALFSEEKMGQRLLFSFLRDLNRMTRVPFEGQPLRGLQILGLLETRLLSFDTLIMLDVNEGVLPSPEEVNPLLPELLRPAVGLPLKEKEEAITRYHFERLVGSSRDVHLVWQASTTPSASGLEGKKTRSRFVEGLLWEEESRAGRLLDDIIAKEELTIPPQVTARSDGLQKTAADREKIAEFLRSHAAGHGISATLLDRYLRCPLRFMYEYLLRLEVPESPLEEVDSAEVGTLVHKALEAYFKPFEGKEYARERHKDVNRLLAIFEDLYRQSDMYSALGLEKRFFLEQAVRHWLEDYLDAAPESTVIESLERRYTTRVLTSLGDLAFGGKVDRIDRREGRRIILDYKTGAAQAFSGSHFGDNLAEMTLPREFGYQSLVAVREAIKDLQLPLYVLLVAGQETAADLLSAYVALSAPLRDGKPLYKERYFVQPDTASELGEGYARWFGDTFAGLLSYLIDHMLESPLFYRATDERDCTSCDYNAVCSMSCA